MRTFKWIVISLFALIVALGVAAYVAVSNYPVEDLKALIEKEAEKATGRKLTINGDVRMEVSLSPSIVMEQVTLQNASWAEEPNMLTLERLNLEVSLWPLISGELSVDRLELVAPVVLLQENADGQANWELSEAKEGGAAGGDGSSSSDTLLSFRSLVLERGKVTYMAPGGAAPRVVVIDSLEGGSAGLDDPLSGTLKGAVDDLPIDIAFSLGTTRQLLGDKQLDLSVQGKLADSTVRLTAAGKQGAPTALEVALSGPSLEPFSKLAESDLPKAPYELKGKAQVAADKVEIGAFNLTLGKSDLLGQLTLATTADRPSVKGQIYSKYLDLDALAAAGGGGSGGAAASTAGGKLIPTADLPLEDLKSLDANLGVKLDEVVSGGLTVRDVTATLVLQQGRLNLSPVSLRAAEGRINGSLTLDAGQAVPPASLALSGSGLRYDRLIAAPASGTLAFNLTVNAAGSNTRQLLSSLDGRTSFSSNDSKLSKAYLGRVAQGLTAVLSPLIGGGSELAIDCLAGNLVWQDGVGRNEGTLVSAKSVTSVVSGTVNLKTETLDLYVDSGSTLPGLSTIVVPLRVSGPIAAPRVLTDPAGTAAAAAKAAGTIMLPPVAVASLLSDVASGSQGGNACQVAVNRIDEEGGPQQFLQDWLNSDAGRAVQEGARKLQQGLGEAAQGVGEAAQGAAEGVGGAAGKAVQGAGDALKSIGQGAGDAGKAIEQGVGEGLKSIFGN